MDRLLPLVYEGLRGLARLRLAGERPGHTLQATALVHDAYLKLIGGAGGGWESRAHFYGIASRAMRQILVDHARRKRAEKRGGDRVRTTISGKPIAGEVPSDELIALDEALDRLNEIDERLRRIVECKYFAGMTETEIAEALDVSDRTVRREWIKARAWLYKELYEEGS